ncbi:hypothetical protein [Chondromyces crocatus]|uniref:Serine protease n=1 Tax=Chondromyces crocatus TaxID=52 RepID=A0A0K1EF03_CHOCO|nr:hypothetical protein [Chondromyces crocatus]AKT39455.1 serine protease [Chondromyces crocatus]
MRTRPLFFLAAAAVLAVFTGCGGSQPAPAQAETKPAAQTGPTADARAVPPGHVARQSLEEVLVQGPPWLLQRVPIEEVIRSGNFVGWKLLALPEAWSEAPLKAGDVVTRVNGQALERPDDLFAVWKGLAKAKEIRFSYERDGKEAEATIPVDGEPTPEVVKVIEEGGPPPAARSGRRKGVTVIEEDRGTGAEDESGR